MVAFVKDCLCIPDLSDIVLKMCQTSVLIRHGFIDFDTLIETGVTSIDVLCLMAAKWPDRFTESIILQYRKMIHDAIDEVVIQHVINRMKPEFIMKLKGKRSGALMQHYFHYWASKDPDRCITAVRNTGYWECITCLYENYPTYEITDKILDAAFYVLRDEDDIERDIMSDIIKSMRYTISPYAEELLKKHKLFDLLYADESEDEDGNEDD
jgi:hypothetical protein